MSRVYRIFMLFLVVSTAALLIAGCGKKEQESGGPVVRPVKTAVVAGFHEGEFTFPATVEAGRKMMVSFRVPGRIVELPIKEGQDVKEGELIARLDPKDYQIAVDGARADFTRAQADFERYTTLYEKDAVPRADLDLKRSQRDVARSKLEEAQKKLDYTHLRAPFAGTIGNRYVENFMDIKVQEQIVDLNNTDIVEIKINAAENLVSSLRSLAAQLEVKSYAEFTSAAGKQYELTLKELSTRADPQTQTFQITFQMPQPDDITLLPGMSANVRIHAKAKAGAEITVPVAVPAIAVIGGETGGNYVWVVKTDDMTVHKVDVVVGQLKGTDEIEIEDGLEGGEFIVVAGMKVLTEGMKVRFWDEQDK
jgi:RND family efflux transporter MFP subunit